MDERVARELIKAHFAASALGAPGGSPDDSRAWSTRLVTATASW